MAPSAQAISDAPAPAGGTSAPPGDRFLGMAITPLNRRRLENFKANRRGYWSMWLFAVLFFLSLFAEFIANDRPIFVWYDGGAYWPVFVAYPETTFRGDFPTDNPTLL